MKRKFTTLLLALLGAIAMFTSCNKEPEAKPAIRFENVSTLRQTVFADQIQAPQVIKFTTTEAWTSSISTIPTSQLRDGEPDWILMTPQAGNAGEHSVTIRLGVNASGADRSAVIMLTVGNSIVSITITQRGTTATGTIPTTPTYPTVPTEPTDPTNPADPTNPSTPTNTMTGKINGTAFAWNGDAGVIDDLIFLEASDANDFNSIMITIPTNVTEGRSYPLTADGDYSAFIMTADDAFDLESGTLTVSEHNTTTRTIKGTFSFVAGDYTITEGAFNYQYASEEEIQEDGFIKAKVNGVEYSEVAIGLSVTLNDNILGISVGAFVTNENSKTMSISFPGNFEVGVPYQFTNEPFGNYKAYYDDVLATSGTLIITSFDETTGLIKGTFSFLVGTNRTNMITDGEFKITFPE